jgi:hypothetical protein
MTISRSAACCARPSTSRSSSTYWSRSGLARAERARRARKATDNRRLARVARGHHESIEDRFRNPKHRQPWIDSLEQHVPPRPAQFSSDVTIENLSEPLRDSHRGMPWDWRWCGSVSRCTAARSGPTARGWATGRRSRCGSRCPGTVETPGTGLARRCGPVTFARFRRGRAPDGRGRRASRRAQGTVMTDPSCSPTRVEPTQPSSPVASGSDGIKLRQVRTVARRPRRDDPMRRVPAGRPTRVPPPPPRSLIL